MLIKREKSLQRSDKVIDTSPAKGQLVRVKTPKRLSLVGLPANQTGYKVLRSDTQGESKVGNPIIRRVRRSETNPVMRLTFPEGTTADQAAEQLKTFGMSGYNIVEADGTICALRSDLKSISKDSTQDIKLNDTGLIATVARSAAGVSNPEDKSAVALASVEFDASKFTLEDVQRWATEKCVDGEVQEPQNSGECYVVRRSDVPEGEETRRLVLEDGVTAVIVRADAASVPEVYATVISEAAYGNWGWGQLDFTARLADKAFCYQMDEAISALRGVLDNVLFYSALPLDVRKDLAYRALAQFGDYMATSMDNLPRQLLATVVRSANPQPENAMTKEASGAATQEAKPNTPATDAADKPLTRSDVQSMIQESVAKLPETLAPLIATAVAEGLKTVQRAAEPPKVETPAEPAKAEPAKVETFSRADMTAAIAEALKPLSEKVEQLASTTVVRNDAGQEKPAEKPAAKKPDDLFRGVFGGLRKKSQRDE